MLQKEGSFSLGQQASRDKVQPKTAANSVAAVKGLATPDSAPARLLAGWREGEAILQHSFSCF